MSYPWGIFIVPGRQRRKPWSETAVCRPSSHHFFCNHYWQVILSRYCNQLIRAPYESIQWNSQLVKISTFLYTNFLFYFNDFNFYFNDYFLTILYWQEKSKAIRYFPGKHLEFLSSCKMKRHQKHAFVSNILIWDNQLD